MIDFFAHFRKAVLLALEHDVLNTAKAAAYSGMLMLFPALMVVSPRCWRRCRRGPRSSARFACVFMQILPADTMAAALVDAGA